MMVYKCFDGDDDEPTKLVQHDVYGQALAIIVDGCRNQFRAAEAILLTRAPWIENANSSGAYDHRVVQQAHDILAAVWRYRSNRTQPSLEFEEREIWSRQIADAWLSWLRSEVDAWSWKGPGIIRATICVISNKNTPEGCAGEDRLAPQLYDLYSEVPWPPACN